MTSVPHDSEPNPAAQAMVANPFVAQVATLQERSKAKGQPRVASTKLMEQTAQLPLWAESVRGLPNTLARSALFTAGNPSDQRDNLKNAEIYSVKGVKIFYTGEELRQDDEDVFLQIVHWARRFPLGDAVEFSAHSLLKALGWDTSSAGYSRLRDVLSRLKVTSVTVSADDMDKGYAGSLIRTFAWDQSRWVVQLEPKIIALFGNANYTWLDWKQRMELPPMAKKLHSYYFTHTQPFDLKVETLRALCGSKIASLSQFRYALKRNLNRLADVGFLSEWGIDKKTDLVSVVRAKPATPDDESDQSLSLNDSFLSEAWSSPRR